MSLQPFPPHSLGLYAEIQTPKMIVLQGGDNFRRPFSARDGTSTDRMSTPVLEAPKKAHPFLRVRPHQEGPT